MKALSVKQPWAWALVHGYKPVENRDWNTNFRGEVYIHASKTFDDEGYEFIKKMLPEHAMPKKEDFFRGGIIGSVVITDCVTDMESEWFFGKYGFVVTGERPCQPKICKGSLGFFEPDFNSTYLPKGKGK